MDFGIQDKVIKKIEHYCRKEELFDEGDGIVLGVSGGADSVFLLAFFCAMQEKWKLGLSVVHVNHGIRGEAARADEEYVKSLSERAGLPFFVYHADIPGLAEKWKMTEEEAGRYYRYQCFEEVRKECGFGKIAVAHHLNDQAETVLFQLFRGSGLRGLGGMHPKQGCIIRPLLGISKEKILETLQESGIEYCEDATNRDNGYSRNFIRNRLFPEVEGKLQKKVQYHIAASASYLRDVMSYMEEQAGTFFREKVKREGNAYVMERSDFLLLPVALRREVVFLMIKGLAGKKKDITGTHIEQVQEIFLGETGKKTMLPYHLAAKREYGSLKLELEAEGKETFKERELKPGEIYEIPYTNGEKRCFLAEKRQISRFSERNLKKYCTKCFDYDKISSVVLFRYPLAGDYFWLDRTGRKKKLGRLFIDEKIPVEKRKSMVVLAEENHVLWIPELERCSAFYYLSGESEQMIYIEEK